MTRRRETLVVAFALLATLLVVAALFPVLLTRPLWLDEVHTLIVASRPGVAQVMSDVSAGIDTAPGLLHLVLWTVGKAFGLSPLVLHAVPFLLVWLGHGFVYAALRRRFDVASSLAGVLAVATHLLVIQMTYEARFYGPWLMLAAAFSWAVGLPPSRRRDAWIAVLAVLICTIHWFGVISLGIMCAAVVLLARRDWRLAVRTVAPAAAGLVVLLLCSPILLSQRAAVTAPSWIPAPDRNQIWVMARTFYVALVPILAVIVIISFSASRLEAVKLSNRQTVKPSNRSAVSLASLALMPVAMLVVSYALQPALLDRYATVATLAWAPLVAYAVQFLRPRARIVFCVLLVGLGVLNYRRSIRGMDGYRRGLARGVNSFTLAVDSSSFPIVFQSRHVQLPIIAAHPRGRERTLFLSIPDSTFEAIFPAGGPLRLMGPFFRFEREAALLHERVYDFPRIVTQAQLDTFPRFLLLGSDASLPPGYRNVERFARAVFPRHAVRRVDPELSLFILRQGN